MNINSNSELRNYNLCIHTDKEVGYCNAVIKAIIFLNEENKIDIYKIFDSLFKKVVIDENAFNYSFSKKIELQNKTFHLFMVALLVFEHFKLSNIKIKDSYLQKIVKNYIESINNFIDHLDGQQWLSIENIFKLKILQERDYMEKEIEYIYNLTSPNFKFLAFLLKINKQRNKNKKIIQFISDYFEKYKKYWDRDKFENWCIIWNYLNRKDKLMYCISQFPEWKQNEYKKMYNL